jgi:hypothetical protein
MKKLLVLILALSICTTALASCNQSNDMGDKEGIDNGTNATQSIGSGEKQTDRATEKKTEKPTEKETEQPLVASKNLSLEPISEGYYQLTGMGRCKDHNIVIPSEYKGGRVVQIRDKAFYNCFDLTGAVVPNSVTHIGEFAFSVSNLCTITISDSVQTIGKYAFSGCTRLEAITIPKDITVINDGTFCQCELIEEVIIPEGVTRIGVEAFSECISLKSIVIPENVVSIEDYAFYKCSDLTSVILPRGLKTIGVSAFGRCKDLLVIEYQGTKAEWEAIEKHYDWDKESSISAVSCIDGVISE